jgi:DHA3 family macrolide efflux protein-like MFS transporter
LLMVYTMIFVNGAITTFYYPARYALVPNLVESEHLIQANTLLASCVAVANVAGRGIGGFVAERMGVEWAIMSNVVAYLISFGLVWRIHMKPHATTSGAAAHPEGGWGEMKEGLGYLWEHKTALPLVALAGALAFMGAIFIVVFIGYAMGTLGLRAGGVGYLFVALGAGGAVGLFVVTHAKRLARSVWLPFFQLLVGGTMLVLMSQVRNPWLAALILTGLASVGAPLMILLDARLQEAVGDQRRGAVFAARGMLTSATMVVAFWLQFGTGFFRHTPTPVVMMWLGEGSIAAALLTVAMFLVRIRRAQ